MVHVAYFKNFLSRNVLLIAGDEDGLTSLAKAFRELGTGQSQQASFESLPLTDVHMNLHVLASVYESRPAGLYVGLKKLFWDRSAEGWLEAAELVEIVAHRRPSNRQLDDNGMSMVMVSHGEFSEPWWDAHGLLGPNSGAGETPVMAELQSGA
jgi:hypothetical protein